MNTFLHVYDITDMPLADPEQSAQPALRPLSGGKQVADSFNLCSGNAGVAVIFSACISPLGNHVSRVVGTSPDKQMGGIAAGPIVTFVANKGPGLEKDARKQKRRPMRPHRFPPVGESPVAAIVGAPHPRPTGIRVGAFIDLAPEQDFWGSGWLKPTIMPRNELHGNSLHPSKKHIVVEGDSGRPPATALAIPVRDNTVWHGIHCIVNTRYVKRRI